MMARTWQRIKGPRAQDYDLLPLSEKLPDSPSKSRREQRRTSFKCLCYTLGGVLLVALGTIYGVDR